MRKISSKNIDMTEGSIFGKMLVFVLPMMATNLLQVAYNAADMMVVSLSHEANSVGAIGMTGPFVNLVLNFFIGFAIGANVTIARRIGAKEGELASRVVHTAIIMAAMLGVISGGIGLVISRPVLSLMGAKDNLLDLATLYTRIYFAGAPFIALTNYAVAIFRSKGDTKTPLFVLASSGLVNVVLNFIFVIAFGMSVDGVAWATVISNAVSAVALIWCLSRADDDCRFDFKKLRVDKRSLIDIIRIGFPAGIQSALFSLSNIMIQSSVLRMNDILAPGSIYEPVVDGNAAVSNLNGFIYTATNSVCQASVAFTSQNVGAGRYDRVKRVMLSSYTITTAVALIFSSFIMIFNHQLLALYGIVDGEGLAGVAYSTAMIKMKLETLTYFILAWMEVSGGVLRALGKSMTSTVVSLIGACLLRVVWLLTVFEYFLTLESIYISYPISWVLTTLISFGLVVIEMRKHIVKNTRTPKVA